MKNQPDKLEKLLLLREITYVGLGALFASAVFLLTAIALIFLKDKLAIVFLFAGGCLFIISVALYNYCNKKYKELEK